MLASQSNNKKIAFLTTCHDDWGGCEELWFRSIPYLKEAGNNIIIYKSNFNLSHPIIKELVKDRIALKPFGSSLRLDKRIFRKLTYVGHKLADPFYYVDYLVKNFYHRLLKDKPNLVIVSQAINFDGLKYAYQCTKLNIPYIIVSHKAVDFYWPTVEDKNYMRETLSKALLCCFVSRHNLLLTEYQFALKLKNSKVIFNPIKMKRQVLQYPSVHDGFRLACPGRFFLLDKGQDILISVFAQKKWRERAINITLMGAGPDLVNIEEMIAFHKITNIAVTPYNSDLEGIWLNHHALILPSRSEGLPLTIIEAMAAGRTIITTNAGGNAEMLEDGTTGFIGEANIRSLDETLERAWQNRLNWESMGKKASEYVKNNIPESPEKNFAELLINKI